MNYLDHSSDDMGSCTPPPTKLRRLVASFWNDNPDSNHDDTLNESHKCYTPNWKEITKRPPSSGSYVYSETYAEEDPYFWIPPQEAVDMDPDHTDIGKYPNIAYYPSNNEVPEESCFEAAFLSPSNFDKQVGELSFESENEMDKKPAAIVDYSKSVPFTSNGNNDEEESIALAPLGPSRRTTAAHEALFSMSPLFAMSPKPTPLDGTNVTTSVLKIQASSKIKATTEELSIPFTKLSRKDNSSRLGYDSMSYSTDDTDQQQRHLPYLNVAMLPKQEPNLLSDTDEEEELLLMMDTRTSSATTTIGPDSSSAYIISGLPSVTPSPNILKQHQQLLIEQSDTNLTSLRHKKHSPMASIKSVARPKALKAASNVSKTDAVNENEFLNKVGKLLYSNDSTETTSFDQKVGNGRGCTAFHPVMKRDNYRELHDMITDMVFADGSSKTTSPKRPPHTISTPIRHSAKTPVKSPFKPIAWKEHEYHSHQVISSDRMGTSMNGELLRPVPWISPNPMTALKPYSHHASPGKIAVMRTPTPRNDEATMEWEHPLNEAPTTMRMLGIAPPPPQYDLHFSLDAPTKIAPPVPSEVVVVPTTYMSTKHVDTKSAKSAPNENYQHSHKSSSANRTVTPTADTLRQGYAKRVKTASTIPSGMVVDKSPHSTRVGSILPTNKVQSRTNRTMYVPPAPINGNEWDGVMLATTATTASTSNKKKPLTSQRHIASAFAPGQRGRYTYHYNNDYDVPIGNLSRNRTYHTTGTTSAAGETMSINYNNMMRRGSSHNCMSSSSRSSSLSNSTFSESDHNKKKRPSEYDRQEA